MLRHHKLEVQGQQAVGTVLQWSTGKEISKSRVLVGVKFDDGEIVEFTEEITDYYAVPSHIRKRADLAPGDDVVPLGLYEGQKVPVRYDPADRKKITIDEPTFHQQALEAYVQAKHAERARMEQQLRDS